MRHNLRLDAYVIRFGSHGDFNMGENDHWVCVYVHLSPYAMRVHDHR